ARALVALAGPFRDPWMSDRREPRRQCFRCRTPKHDCMLANVLNGAILLLDPNARSALRWPRAIAMRGGEHPSAASPQCLGPRLRQPPDGPVERNLSCA